MAATRGAVRLEIRAWAMFGRREKMAAARAACRAAACAVWHAAHYDVFGGREQEGQIYPLVRGMIIAGD
jgi:hypothetical protein